MPDLSAMRRNSRLLRRSLTNSDWAKRRKASWTSKGGTAVATRLMYAVANPFSRGGGAPAHKNTSAAPIWHSPRREASHGRDCCHGKEARKAENDYAERRPTWRKLCPGPFATPGVQLDRRIGNGDAKRGADGARHQCQIAAMGAHKLGCDRQSQDGAATTRGSLERLEQVGARLFRNARAGVRHFQHHHAALASASDADLIARRIALSARLQRLHGIARHIDQHTK